MSDRRSSIIKTAHGARVRYDHGDNCAECRALGPGELEAIVRDLAAAASRPDGERCKWCDTTGEHREHCVWQRSREFVSAHPVSGDPADA